MRTPSAIRHSFVGTFLAILILIAGIPTARAIVNSITKVMKDSPTTNGQGSLLFIGDSLTVGTAYFGRMQEKIIGLHTWTAVNLDAKTGRKASAAPSIMDKKISDTTTAVVIALGTNDMISRRETWYPAWVIEEVMNHANGLPVLWINVKFSPTARGDWRQRATRFNAKLEQAKIEWPNLYTADWNSFFKPSGGIRNVADGVHLTIKAYKHRASFVEDVIKRFGTEIVNATSTTSSTSTTTTSSTTTTTTVPQSSTTSSTTSPTTPSP